MAKYTTFNDLGKQYTPIPADYKPPRYEQRECATVLEAYRLRRDLQAEGLTVFIIGTTVTWLPTAV